MPAIKPISDLRNYPSVLKEIAPGSPVFLTKNGRGKFVLMDMDEYEQSKAAVSLLKAFVRGESSAKERGKMTFDELQAALGAIGNAADQKQGSSPNQEDSFLQALKDDTFVIPTGLNVAEYMQELRENDRI